MTRLSCIAAMDRKRCIGVGNDLPWRISADLKRFKALTMAKPMIMGRKTFESLGKPLPDRLHIVVSRTMHKDFDNVVFVSGLDEAVQRARQQAAEEIMIIGGGQIFALALPMTDRLYLTVIETDTPTCDAFFPDFDQADWELTERAGPFVDEKSGLRYAYETYDRAKG